VLQKKIYKSFMPEPSERFFQTLHLAMWVSDYRNKDFRVSLERVAPAPRIAKKGRAALIPACGTGTSHHAFEVASEAELLQVKLRKAAAMQAAGAHARVLARNSKNKTARSEPGCSST
jgi:hypothetical protein